MHLTSPAFASGSTIPGEYSNYGANRRPALHIADVPADARSLALILDDPDAPSGTFTHWIAFNLAPDTRELPGDAPLGEDRQGLNSRNQPAYTGPRPPDREHRYFFRLYALDRELDLPPGASRAAVESAMRHHVLAQAELMGRFAPPAAPSPTPPHA